MKRQEHPPRPDWQAKVENLGFGYHSLEGRYWDETAHYCFSEAQIAQLEQATKEVWEICLATVEDIISQGRYERFQLPDYFIPLIEASWENDAPSIYGRMDFSFDGQSPPKLLEFNADTPTSLFEAAVVQWYWLQDCYPKFDQFNGIHEQLVHTWGELMPYLHDDTLYFACLSENLEDLTTTEYLRDCAIQANFKTSFIELSDIGWHEGRNCFTDLSEAAIRNLFKLYPYEWLINEEFGPHLAQSPETHWIEPAWKLLLSSKAILPLLWAQAPNHPNLLPCFFSQGTMRSYAKKPIYSREGANISLVEQGKVLAERGGDYGEEGFIYQALHKLPNFQGNYPLIGSWLIGQEAVGIGIRETSGLITDNLSRFIPHRIL